MRADFAWLDRCWRMRRRVGLVVAVLAVTMAVVTMHPGVGFGDESTPASPPSSEPQFTPEQIALSQLDAQQFDDQRHHETGERGGPGRARSLADGVPRG